MEAKATLKKHVVTFEILYDDTHILNYYKTMSNVIDEDRRYGCRPHV